MIKAARATKIINPQQAQITQPHQATTSANHQQEQPQHPERFFFAAFFFPKKKARSPVPRLPRSPRPQSLNVHTESLQGNHRDAVFALAILAQAERLNERMMAEVILDTSAKDAGTFAMYDIDLAI